jgi:hypothetical protein
VDSIFAVQQRIRAIQALIPPAQAQPATAAQTAQSSTAFASVLNTVATDSAKGYNAVDPSKATGKLVPPAELLRYGNGKIPADALQSIGKGNHRLWAPAGKGFNAMEAAAAKDGVKIGVTDSYRTYESQVDLAKRKGLYKNGGLAATPGTSNHGWGMSMDLDLDSKALAWMREHGKEYGFVEDVPREPWHWTYRGGAVK